MDITCWNCGAYLGKYIGAIVEGHRIEAKYFVFANGKSPKPQESVLRQCDKCKASTDIVSTLQRKFRTENLHNALQVGKTEAPDASGGSQPEVCSQGGDPAVGGEEVRGAQGDE